MWSHSPPRSGTRWISGSTLALLLLLPSCNYSFRQGAGFPDYIRTVAILPFENETDRFELSQEIHRELLKTLPGALGLRPAGRDQADAVVRGTIRTYSLSAPNYRSSGSGGATQVLVRRVNIGVEVEIIDVDENLILWENRSVRGLGEYLEASESEEQARNRAIEFLIQAIVDGAQSNW